jgi:hypothetical protein
MLLLPRDGNIFKNFFQILYGILATFDLLAIEKIGKV